MSTQGGRPAVTVAVFFIAAIFLAAWAELPVREEASWRERAAALEKVEAEMTSDPRLHFAVDPPQFSEPTTFCLTCHPSPPHGGSGSGPAFLNHHATLMDCLVCHWALISGGRPDPVWDLAAAREGLSLLRISPSGGGELAALRGEVTARQLCFDRGLACRDCHAPGRFGSYLRPGLPEAAEKAFETLPEFLTLGQGEKWYFPHRR